MIVYKFDSWSNSPRRGFVLKETEKQYKVLEGRDDDRWDNISPPTTVTWDGVEFTWRKDECYPDIASASAAHIERAQKRLEHAKEQVLRFEKDLEIAQGWMEHETKVLAEAPTPPTVTKKL